MKICVIGTGKIGYALLQEADKIGWMPVLTTTSREAHEVCGDEWNRWELVGPEALARRAEELGSSVAFLCIPSNQPDAALGYIRAFAERNIPVVTAEKAALAERWDDSMQYRRHLNYDATVGGGSGMLPFIRDHVGYTGPAFHSLHAIVNGTTNFIFWYMDERGETPEVAVKCAILGEIAEPSENLDAMGVLNGELRDIAQKTAILLNECRIRPHQSISTGDITIAPMTRQLVTEGRLPGSRLILSITRTPRVVHAQLVVREFGDFVVSIGLRSTGHFPFHNINAPNAQNAVVIHYGHGADEYVLAGPGAGPLQTARRMLTSARMMVKR